MDFFEAMKMMKDGTKVKLKSWPEDRYIGIKEEDVKIFGKRRTKYSVINPEETDISPCMPFSALVSNEWEISTLD
jgi:hypothetical protein